MRAGRELAVGRNTFTQFFVTPEVFKLDTRETLTPGKVRVPGWSAQLDGENVEPGDFFLGKYEVTNREYQAFVDAGGSWPVTCGNGRSTRSAIDASFSAVVAKSPSLLIVAIVSSVEEIEAAIRALPASERARLIRDLPKLFPEMDGDAAWERLFSDERPRPALSRLLDEAEAAVNEDVARFPETTDDEFKRRS